MMNAVERSIKVKHFAVESSGARTYSYLLLTRSPFAYNLFLILPMFLSLVGNRSYRAMLIWKNEIVYLLTCTCVGIHPGWVDPASLIELITSRTEALWARRPCASSLETFTQSFLHLAWPKTRGPKKGSRPTVTRCVLLIVVTIHWWVGSTPRSPVPVPLHLVALQLKPSLPGLRIHFSF